MKSLYVAFTKFTLLGSIFLGASFADEGPRTLNFVSETKLGYSPAGKAIGVWSGGALIQVESSGNATPGIVAFDRTGQMVFTSALVIPDSVRTYVNGVSRSPDGFVVACGTAWSADGRSSGYIAWYSADGLRQHVLRTDPYIPYRVTAGRDGGFWTMGLELVDMAENKPGVDKQAGVLRHYDQEGKLLASRLPRNTFSTNLMLTSGKMAAGNDRSGWVSHDSQGHGQYTEVANGDPLAHTYAIPRFATDESLVTVTGLAITASGVAVIGLREAGQVGTRLFRLNRTAGDWTELLLPPELAGVKGGALLYGADGEDLVLGILNLEHSEIRFYSLK